MTTIEDLYLWDQNFYDNKLEGGSEFIDLMLSNGPFNYGFALIHTVYKGFKVIYHSGLTGGFTSMMMRFPEENLTIILLRNYEIAGSEDPKSVTAMALEIANVYLFGQGEAYSQGCDFNGDGKLGIADAVTLLLLARDDPSDPLVDWNSDGVFSWADVVLLVHDIWNGHCPPQAPALLALDSKQVPTINVDALTEEQIAYLEKMMDQLDLTEEQEAEYRLVLYGEAGAAMLPKAYSLEQNSPNPFNPATTISYRVPEDASERITLKVYDIRGRLVRTLVEGIRGAGTYSVFWDGRDEAGREVASGVYFYRLNAGEFTQTRKMVILK